MKVLFQSYFDIGRIYGGGPSVINGLAESLRKLDVEVTLHNYWEHDPHDFDLVHYFSLYQNEHWLRHQPSDPPLVVTPISWLACSRRQRWEEKLKFVARALRHHTRDRRRLGYPMAIPRRFFPNSEGEARLLASAQAIPRALMTIVPHGVPDRFGDGDAGLFVRTHGVNDFALCVGRFEQPRKNQLALIRALRNEAIPVVFIGGPDSGFEEYYQRCRDEAGASMTFLPPLRHDDPMLVSAYHAARTVVMPALLESPGLSGLEGALAGANIAATANGSTREYFGEDAWYFDPSDLRAMRDAVVQAQAAPRGEALRQRVRETYTWDRIAAVQLRAYEAVLQDDPQLRVTAKLPGAE